MRKRFAILPLALFAIAGWTVTWKLWHMLRAAEMQEAAAFRASDAIKRDVVRLRQQLKSKGDPGVALKIQKAPEKSPAARPWFAQINEGDPEYFRRVVEDPEV